MKEIRIYDILKHERKLPGKKVETMVMKKIYNFDK